VSSSARPFASTRNRWSELRTLDDLEEALARFPDDQEGNREVAQYLWGNNHWTRVQWLGSRSAGEQQLAA
jgi:hypothetical protein